MKKFEKRLKHLTSKYHYMSLKGFQLLIENKSPYRRNEISEVIEIRSIFQKLGITDEEVIQDIWMTNHAKQAEVRSMYELSPIKERKDNKNTINYSRTSCRSNRNKIRLPKKCRKTAWKRFFKLFPFMVEKLASKG